MSETTRSDDSCCMLQELCWSQLALKYNLCNLPKNSMKVLDLLIKVRHNPRAKLCNACLSWMKRPKDLPEASLPLWRWVEQPGALQTAWLQLRLRQPMQSILFCMLLLVVCWEVTTKAADVNLPKSLLPSQRQSLGWNAAQGICT